MNVSQCFKVGSRLVCGALVACILVAPFQSLAKDRQLENDLDEAFKAGELDGLHSVLVLHRGKTLAERYYPGKDERWGAHLGVRQPDAASLHDLRSVTKSITGLLYGIALSEGLVPGIDQSLVAQFPEYPDLAADPARGRMLVRHALSMKLGTEWNEDLPYTDPRNSEIAMERSSDRYRFVLDRPMVKEPGNWWDYNGGATAIIGRLIAKGAKMPIDEYAKRKLFAPLGIEKFEWIKGGDGVPSTASGLRMNIHDLAKIGRLVLNDGVWHGRRIVPADWLKVSFTPHAHLHSGIRYGFFWWLAPEGSPPTWVAGIGNGGQRLMVSPNGELVVAVFAGNYNKPDAWKVPVKVIAEFVVPAVRGK